ncbi:hypothetical protein AB0I28_31575 [Phytomonospora sp. NPDC050363]|uniref:hypothetical protein n=1 Tax=Phytomonospora sp. NPDC050363 TaxID=3155642 RepID=UPI0033ED1297
MFVHASPKTRPGDFLWECRRAVKEDTAHAAVLADLRGDPVFHVVSREALLDDGGGFTLEDGEWVDRWELLGGQGGAGPATG